MEGLIRVLLRYRNVVLIVFLALLAVGAFAFFQLDIEAYPDPSPPMVEFITQYPVVVRRRDGAAGDNPSRDRPQRHTQVGTNSLDQHLRAKRREDVLHLRQRLLYGSSGSTKSLQSGNLPNNLQPQLSPESPVGEIYRYQLTGPGYSLNELKATQDWLLVREMKQVPGISMSLSLAEPRANIRRRSILTNCGRSASP